VTTLTVAAANLRPRWLDPDATTDVVVQTLQEAAARGVDLVAFGETFLSGYPHWVARTGGAAFDDALQKRCYAAYLDAAVTLDGPHVARIVEACHDLGVFAYVGLTERGTSSATGTVFATLLAVDPVEGVVSAHRKLRPTYEERLVWGPGDGHGLRVHAFDGVRVGGLNCWENWMPQARHAMYALGEDLHVSVWPGARSLTRDITRFVALEGRVWSLAAGGVFSLADVPTDFPAYELLAASEEEHGPVGGDGGSALAAPDGSWVVEPVSTEQLVVGTIDTAAVRAARQNFDPTGHYARPDVFHVEVDRRRQQAATFTD
jgi:nitrilase